MNFLCLRSAEFPKRAGFPMHLHLREYQSRMESCQAQGSNGNHHTVQNDKVGLVLHDRVAPSIGHLTNTEDTTNEDGQVREGEAAGKQLESCRIHELDRRGFELRSVGAHPGGVISNHGSKDEESEHLPHDTSHHEVVANILHVRAIISCSCDASTGSLDDEGEKVGEAEDPGVKLGSYAREVGAELESNVFEGKVYSGGDEGRGDDETTNLDFKSIG